MQTINKTLITSVALGSLFASYAANQEPTPAYIFFDKATEKFEYSHDQFNDNASKVNPLSAELLTQNKKQFTGQRYKLQSLTQQDTFKSAYRVINDIADQNERIQSSVIQSKLITGQFSPKDECYLSPNQDEVTSSDLITYETKDKDGIKTKGFALKKAARSITYLAKNAENNDEVQPANGQLYELEKWQSFVNDPEAFGKKLAQVQELNAKYEKLKQANAANLRIDWAKWHRDRLAQGKFIANPAYLVGGSLIITAVLAGSAVVAGKKAYNKRTTKVQSNLETQIAQDAAAQEELEAALK
jgi:outer membrane murein-binding lipoprotein Lpp